MKHSIHLKSLNGYDDRLESARQAKLDEFFSVPDREAKRRAFQGLASLTALRSAVFIAEYERELGLIND